MVKSVMMFDVCVKIKLLQIDKVSKLFDSKRIGVKIRAVLNPPLHRPQKPWTGSDPSAWSVFVKDKLPSYSPSPLALSV